MATITFTDDDHQDPYPTFVDLLDAAFKFAAEHKDSFGQGSEAEIVMGVGSAAKGFLYAYDEEAGDAINLALKEFQETP